MVLLVIATECTRERPTSSPWHTTNPDRAPSKWLAFGSTFGATFEIGRPQRTPDRLKPATCVPP